MTSKYMPQPRTIHLAFMCELCNYETLCLEKIKQHLITSKHQEREIKEHEDSLAWFCYFGHVKDHVCIKDDKSDNK